MQASLDFAADKDAAAHAISLLGMLGKGPGLQLLGLPPTAAAPLPEGLLQQVRQDPVHQQCL